MLGRIVHPALEFTRADYEKLPEDLCAELIDGVLVKEPSPSFEHQELSKRIFLVLDQAVGGWRAQFGPLDVHIDEHNVLEPDLLVLREDSRPASASRADCGAPTNGSLATIPSACRT